MFLHPLRSRIQYKIIVPFLLLTLLVALAGSAAAFLFVTGNAQERLNNQLAQTARNVADDIVAQESNNLTFLRELVFASPNRETGAPAVADALAAHDAAGLGQAIDPFIRISSRRGVRLDRLIVFDDAGRTVLDRERGAGPVDAATWTEQPARDLSSLWFVPRILAGAADARGDKYAGLLDLGDGARYLYTVAPVVAGERVVGGVVIATRFDRLLADLAVRSQSALATVYDASAGRAFACSMSPVGGLESLDARPELMAKLRDLALQAEHGVFDTAVVNDREYQLAFAPLAIRGDIVGLLSVALASDYVVGPWSDLRPTLVGLTIALMLAIIGLGVYVARQITRPVEELLSVAQAVTGGNLDRRSDVRSEDEIGMLSDAFNDMTGHLLTLYRVVHAEAGRRAAIVASITDGVIVCDASGRIELLNPAAQRILDLAGDAPTPESINDLRFEPLGIQAPNFGGARSPDLYRFGERVVRVERAPVHDPGGTITAIVIVLHDMTDDVAIDRAKTSFIATISHELRTPLTIIGGNADLLARGLVGSLSDEQRELVSAIHSHSRTMTALVNNVITIAGLDSGSLTFDIEPVDLAELVRNMLWPVRKAATAKGLTLAIDIPEDLPDVHADATHLHQAIMQLLDNAVRYTEAGSVRVTAEHRGDVVRVDVCDSGPGIPPEQHASLFTRFARGAEGINSAERGMGLGLAIASELIQRQGGTLWLESSSDQGSTFSFTLRCVTGEPVEENNLTFASAA